MAQRQSGHLKGLPKQLYVLLVTVTSHQFIAHTIAREVVQPNIINALDLEDQF